MRLPGLDVWWRGFPTAVKERFLGSVSSVRFLEIARRDPVIVLPIGATEQHGPHLPLFTDSLIAQAVLVEAFARLPADHACYFLYPLGSSYSMEHADFPGTISLSADTMLSVLTDIASSLARSGVGRIVLLNAHGGNLGLLQLAAREIRLKTGQLVLTVHAGSLLKAERSDPREAELGIHAGETETSILLALMPEWVDMTRANREFTEAFAGFRHLSLEGRFPVAWKTTDHSKSGTFGDPTAATAQKGESMLEDMADTLAEILMEFARFRLSEGRGRDG